MIHTEILYRLLQISSGVGFLSLLIICMNLHGVKWWLPIPIYGLSFMCLLTLLTSLFVKWFVFEVTVATILTLAIAALTVALHSLLGPVARTVSEMRNRHLLCLIIPGVGLILLIWAASAGTEHRPVQTPVQHVASNQY